MGSYNFSISFFAHYDSQIGGLNIYRLLAEASIAISKRNGLFGL